MNKPYIGVPMGDPAGIGPEIVVKSIVKQEINDCSNSVVIGDKKVLQKAIEICNVDLQIKVIDKIEDGEYNNKTLNLMAH